MDKIIEDQWTQALATLTGSVSPDRNYKASKGVLDKLALATSMLMTAIDPEIPPDKPDAFHRDAMENVVPLLQDMELQYQEYISAGTPYSGSAEWVIPAFYNIVHMVHARFTKSRMLAYIFDERLRPAADRDPPLDISSLKVTSRFLTDFSAELAIRLPPSFDEVAYLYFETVFRQYEEVHGDMAPGHIADMAGHYTRQGRDPQTEITGQHLGKKRRRVMQDGRFAMDLFVDDKDDELVEQIFHGGTGTADVEALEKEDHMQTYLDLCQRLEEIGFASHMTDVVTRMLYKRVESKILTSFKKRWSVATLESEDPTGRKRYKMWASRLEFYFFKTFGDVRIKEFFDIIVECPDSKPAVLDLKTCIEWTGQRDQLQNAILAAMEKRLLHPGAETTDIIEFYICTIKYLRILDPSGVMLDRAARAINQYLRTRDDTMRAIVSCIVDDSSDLLTNSTEGIQSNVEADDEGSDDDTWVPEPVNAGPDLSSARRRMADIISVLANIYDTNDRFIEEFQTILADRLLHATDFKIDRE
ncbi:Anaphase-promoting complex subunit 2, partial [Gamsiella multidivaricata]